MLNMAILSKWIEQSRLTRRSFLRLSGTAVGTWIGARVLAPLRPARARALGDGPAIIVRGVVFHDRDGSGVRSADSPGIPGVRLSNGRDIVTTDEQGRYELPATDDTIIFLLKPRNWTTPVNEHNIPQFYYIHKPKGSPASLRYKGVDPTGELPESVDFPLIEREEPDAFDVVVMTDTHVGTPRILDMLQRETVPDLMGVRAAFGFNLGDIVWDNLDYYGPYTAAVGLAGIPWHHVIGNHDINFDAPAPRYANETFARHYGPSWYAFDYGRVHFLVLDNIRGHGDGDPTTRGFSAELGEDQMEFVRNDLRDVPKDRLVVFMMHVPIWRHLQEPEEIHEFFKLFEGRSHVLSLGGHHHRNQYAWLREQHGWPNPEPLYHRVCGAASGNWWRGLRDEYSIPHAMMRDGTPKGYFLFSFDGNRYSYRYKVIRRGEDSQMHIVVPSILQHDGLAEAEVLVNVYSGNDRSRTEMRIGEGEWVEMELTRRNDPLYERTYTLQEEHREAHEALPGLASQGPPRACSHLWVGTLPEDVPAGTHLLQVRSTDMFGQVVHGRQVIHVQ